MICELAPSCRSEGSAGETWNVSRPSKKVPSREWVRSTSWSTTARSPTCELGTKRPARDRCDERLSPERCDRPDVGAVVDAVVDAVRRYAVPLAVAGQERHVPAADLSDHRRRGRGRGTGGRLDVDRLEVIGEGVESGHAEDGDIDAGLELGQVEHAPTRLGGEAPLVGVQDRLGEHGPRRGS